MTLANNAPGDVDAPSAWTLDDLMGAYVPRDAIEGALEMTWKAGDDIPLPTVAAADALLRSFCRPDDRHLLETREPKAVGTGWWWGLIPRTGPIAAEAGYLSA